MNDDPRYRSSGPEQALAHVIEEAGEMLAAAGKCKRFGPYSVNPELPTDQQETNIAWLLREMNDVRSAMDVFERELALRATRGEPS